MALLLALPLGGCAGRHAGARTLASLGTFGVLAGGGSWASGEAAENNGHPDGGRALINAGFVSVGVGLALIVAAGGWLAFDVSCRVDPDCDEEEQCREVPAPPGGIPYKQCMPR
jgi:hypothetical protein